MNRETIWGGIVLATLAVGVALIVTACTTAQVDRAQQDIAKVNTAVQQACAVAMPLAGLATPLPVAGPYIAAGVQVGCGTAAGLAKLASDPTSVAWLNQQVGLLRAALGKPA